MQVSKKIVIYAVLSRAIDIMGIEWYQLAFSRELVEERSVYISLSHIVKSL